MQHLSDLLKITEKKDEERTNDNYRIYLYQGDNYKIWFENWCRMEQLASLYFENRKSNVFAVSMAMAIGIAYVVYSWWMGHNLWSANMVTVYVGVVFFIVAFVRLLLSSMRFSNLQRRHIGLLQNQRGYALHQMEVNEECSEKRQFSVIKYIEWMIDEIEYRSLSPTIAGVSLDKALVKLSFTTIIGFATPIITYLLKNKT